MGYCAWCDARGIGLWETQGWFVQCLLRVALLSGYVVGGALWIAGSLYRYEILPGRNHMDGTVG